MRRDALVLFVFIVLVSLAFGFFAVYEWRRSTLPVSATADGIIIDVSKDGYFLANGTRIDEVLKVRRGHTKLVFKYAEDLTKAVEHKELYTHQLIVRNDVSKFFLRSAPLSPENMTTTLEFDAGANGEKEYQLYCEISCLAMVHLFKRIEVAGDYPAAEKPMVR